MSIDKAVLCIFGVLVLLSLGLALTVSPNWFLLTGFVGLNLIQVSLTGFCPAAMLLKRLGMKPGSAFS